uniref:Zinc finger protein n=1 Tax=Ciona intestinalis TaxID=7719 RepID=Q1RQ02_CIOIN|nr:zinc finger protein [Ciona intestinalis]BAE93283.1 zinc finger protein [Ciona intestinalis]|eukprot:NP_001072017.1 zinc finger protein [Ciona intestinalis]
MTISLEFEECIKDSPKFRDLVHQSEVDVVDLESQIDRMVKHCSVMVDSGKVYNNACKGFIGSVNDVGYASTDDAFVQGTLKRFTSTMSELSSFHTMLFDQAQRSVRTQLNNFLREEVKPTKDLKKTFDKVSDDYLSSLNKHAAANKLKPNEVEDTNSVLTSSRNCFRSVAMDYVYQINMLHKKKKFQSVDKILSYMHALFTFFHQGYDLLKDLEPYMKSVSGQLEEMCKRNEESRKSMIVEQERHQSMTGDSGMYMTCVNNAIVIEGHLFKRASNAFKTWNRRWFTIKDNKLFYQKKKDDLTVVVDDIRLCTVRLTEETERRFCFEVVLPGKSFLLQAESDDARTAWIKAIQSSIGAAFKDTMEETNSQQIMSLPVNKILTPVSTAASLSRTSSSSSSNSNLSNETTLNKKETKSGENTNPTSFLEEGANNVMSKIYQVPGNKTCADCGKAEPRWASISLGITLCIECSGCHRSLGVHISKVRSLTLDQWEPEVVKVMLKLGNSRVNEIYTANATSDDQIKPGSSNDSRLAFIQAKYVDRKFAMPLPKALGPQPAYHGATGRRLTRWTVSKRKRTRPSPNRSPNRPRSPKPAVQIHIEPVDGGGGDAVSSQGEDETDDRDDIIVFGHSVASDGKEYEETEICKLENLHPDLLLYRATEAANLPVMLLAKCNKAKVNWMNDADEGKTALMQAAIVGSVPACEFMLANGAKIETFDWKKRTALHYAALHNHTSVACQLLKRRMDLNAVDEDGKSALDIAVDEANADIVTLIRLKKMSDEMKEDNSSTSQTDALVTDVFRDFSQRTFPNLHSPDPSDANQKFNILGATLLTPETRQTTSTDDSASSAGSVSSEKKTLHLMSDEEPNVESTV